MTQEELFQYYIIEDNTKIATMEHFNIGRKKLDNFLKTYNISKPTNRNAHESYKAVMQRVPKEVLEEYYITENHSKEDTLHHFNLTWNAFRFIIAEYGIKKSAAQIAVGRAERFRARYGVENPFQLESVKSKIKETNFTRYGVSNAARSKESLEKTQQTCLEKYGTNWPCNTKQAMVGRDISGPEQAFMQRLEAFSITNYEREFTLDKYRYDFRVNNILIEISPWATHNSTFGVFGKSAKDKNYHRDKAGYARKQGYRCITIFDWDNQDLVIKTLLAERERVYARQCIVREVALQEASSFCSDYHLQGAARCSVAIGLYFNGGLVAVMTFDAPRYAKKYQWELIRYCASKKVIGGAEKLWKYFISTFQPSSVISYCDLSKFSGHTYERLGFSLFNKAVRPSLHWYRANSPINRPHITDNLLRARGFDQLFAGKPDDTGGVYLSYGKGTSNEALMEQVAGYVKVYDCGQNTYLWES